MLTPLHVCVAVALFPGVGMMAQEPESNAIATYCGISGGLQRVSLGPISEGPGGFIDPPVDFPTTFGFSGHIDAGALIPVSPGVGISADVGFGISSASLGTSIQGIVSPKGIPIPVTLQEGLELRWYELMMSTRLNLRVTPFLEAELGGGFVFPASILAHTTEKIIDPPTATYDERTRERVRFSGALVGVATYFAEARILGKIALAQDIDMLPYLQATIVPSSLGLQVDLTTAKISAGIQLRVSTNLFIPKEIPQVILTAPQIPDELLINKDRKFETPLPEVSIIRRPYLATATQVQLTDMSNQTKSKADVVVRVLNCLRLRLIETNVDAGSTIWDATKFELIHKDSILDATPPTAVIRVRSTAEAGVQSGVVRAMSGGNLAFEDTWTSSTDTVFSWPLRDLPVTALAGDTTTISIQSTVVDYFGDESVSPPQNIVVIRSRPNKKSALVPDLVSADFPPATFIHGTNELSKAGRGLVAALTDHAREARKILFRGSAEKCKRIISELGLTGNVNVEVQPSQENAQPELETITIQIER